MPSSITEWEQSLRNSNAKPQHKNQHCKMKTEGQTVHPGTKQTEGQSFRPVDQSVCFNSSGSFFHFELDYLRGSNVPAQNKQ